MIVECIEYLQCRGQGRNEQLADPEDAAAHHTQRANGRRMSQDQKEGLAARFAKGCAENGALDAETKKRTRKAKLKVRTTLGQCKKKAVIIIIIALLYQHLLSILVDELEALLDATEAALTKTNFERNEKKNPW